MNEELNEIQQQIWDAATLNKDNPLGASLLDAHFAAIQRLVADADKCLGCGADTAYCADCLKSIGDVASLSTDGGSDANS